MNKSLSLCDQFGRPLRDLRISVTDRCNFRCSFCMPVGENYEFLPRRELLTFEEIARLSRIFLHLGVGKLRITGGEPLVRKDLPKLIALLSSLEGLEDLALTTNGVLLGAKARALKEAGLKRVTVSFHALKGETFQKIVGRKVNNNIVLQSMEKAAEAGLGPIKVNVVAIRGVNDDHLVDLARYFKDKGFILRFIEYMDVGTVNEWNMEGVVPASEILERINSEMPLEAVEENYRGEVASRYRYCDGEGEIGIISSVTQPFCRDCTRLRLSSEGSIYTCLFATSGTDLKEPLRQGASDDELVDIISQVWRERDDRYSEERFRAIEKGEDLPKEDKIEMFRLGG